mmetsp:Transcript_92884/g.139400  ORF Transcript_92884/g.139400 Transcript_92884/m.139400 type:complete len:275 (-) Transcript_92884:3-827(-)|eukprot:1074182-Rhodomonas_salina.1
MQQNKQHRIKHAYYKDQCGVGHPVEDSCQDDHVGNGNQKDPEAVHVCMVAAVRRVKNAPIPIHELWIEPPLFQLLFVYFPAPSLVQRVPRFVNDPEPMQARFAFGFLDSRLQLLEALFQSDVLPENAARTNGDGNEAEEESEEEEEEEENEEATDLVYPAVGRDGLARPLSYAHEHAQEDLQFPREKRQRRLILWRSVLSFSLDQEVDQTVYKLPKEEDHDHPNTAHQDGSSELPIRLSGRPATCHFSFIFRQELTFSTLSFALLSTGSSTHGV